MDRRHYLLSVVNLEKYREYLFNYVYYNIIPDTIDSKNVKDIGKAKVLEIQGNSEVVNQLVIDGNFTSSTGWFTIASSGTITVSNSIAKVTKTTSSTIYLYRANSDYPTLTNHKYLHTAWVKLSANGTARFTCGNSYMTPQSITANTWTKISFIASPTTFGGFFSDIEDSNSLSIGETMEVKEYQVIDLTKEYPFDTPTTLTDNRVQAILNRGYIPYNTGKIKDSIVSEIDFEPYNLFDGELEIGAFANTNVTACHSKNFIKVTGSKTYTFDMTESSIVSTTADRGRYIKEYDEYFNEIKQTNNYSVFSTQFEITLSPETHYVKLMIFVNNADFTNNFPTGISFHRTGTRTGYAKNIPNQYLPDEYQGVEYIYQEKQNSGGTDAFAYIQPDLSFSDIDSVEFDVSIYENGGPQNNIILCAFNTNYYIVIDRNTHRANGFPSSSWNPSALDLFSDEQRHKVRVSNLSSNDTTQIRTGWDWAWWHETHWYRLRFYKNNTLLRDMIPCYKKSDNTVGMYDLVNRKFYTNAGQGRFLTSGTTNNNTIIKLPAPLQLGGVGTSQNTFAVTSSAYVFTRNEFYGDLGTLSWHDYDANGRTYSTSDTSYIKQAENNANILLCSKYITANLGTQQAVSWYNNRIFITDSNFAGMTGSQIKTALSGIPFKYQLATPQTITIPRKHLAVVDLGSLNWTQASNGYFTAIINNMKLGAINSTFNSAFCSKYIVYSNLNRGDYTDKGINYGYEGGGFSIRAKDTSISTDNATTFKNALSGIYLWYETENEVEDFVDKALFERGGTISTSEFSWVENQQAIIPTISTQELNGITLTNNGDGSVTISGTANAQTTFTLMGNLSRDIPLGHKVFITNFANPSQSTYHLYDAYESNLTSAMVSSPYGYIKTKEGSSTIISPTIRVENGTVLFEPQKVYVMYFDLTVGFGAGNEPTSVNDWRIQYILEHGYLPTNTSGTFKSIDTEVLCDIETKLQVE